MKSVPVAELLSDDAAHLGLKLIYGKKIIDDKDITHFRIQKPGLALAGYCDHIHSGRVQILGNTEVSYLWTLTPDLRKQAMAGVCQKGVCCFIVTKDLHLPQEVIDTVKVFSIPLFKTDRVSSETIIDLSVYLEDRLAPDTVCHGVFLDVFGIGTLITGRSGIGKSECAVELIKRGHRLVADDAVRFKRIQDYLEGSSSDILRYHMEVRGLGIINIKDMFGVAAIRLRKKLELVIEFTDWNPDISYDRLGLDNVYQEILRHRIPKIVLPISAGRNMAVIVEIAARNHLLKIMGYDSAKQFAEKLTSAISDGDAHNPMADEIEKRMGRWGVE
ncbi:HPr(Ser) kinase/phosphatase [Seleniivibrio woodruffii]|uniref:HPr(Ser) kinase/phosphatase n=1 Tax=Seleniivibrio woodruffii TaxID=1078050 RepID=UPI0039E23B55